jgi:Protein of unknown function (DUF1804)
MAHAPEKITRLRGCYVYERLAIEQAAKKAGISIPTAKRWKLEAKAKGDNWDTARSALALGDENFKHLSQKLLQDYLVQHQATIDMLASATDMSAIERAEALASLSDSFNKTMASFKRMLPEVNKQAIALDVMQRLAKFTQEKHPSALAALLQVIEPFGEEIAKAYG